MRGAVPSPPRPAVVAALVFIVALAMLLGTSVIDGGPTRADESAWGPVEYPAGSGAMSSSRRPVVASVGDGTFWAAWEADGTHVRAARRAAGANGAWGAVGNVAAGFAPAIAVDDGRPHVAWVNEIDGAFNVYYSWRTEDGWQLPRNVSATQSFSTAPTIAIAVAEGRRWLAWSEGDKLYLGRSADGNSWSAAPLVINGRLVIGASPALLALDRTTVELAWQGDAPAGQAIRHAVQRDGGWSIPETISDPGESAILPALGALMDGRRVLAWRSGSPARPQLAIGRPGRWDWPMDAAAGDMIGRPALAAPPPGGSQSAVAWVDPAANLNVRRYDVSAEAWSNAAVLASEGPSDPALAAGTGGVLLAWSGLSAGTWGIRARFGPVSVALPTPTTGAATATDGGAGSATPTATGTPGSTTPSATATDAAGATDTATPTRTGTGTPQDRTPSPTIPPSASPTDVGTMPTATPDATPQPSPTEGSATPVTETPTVTPSGTAGGGAGRTRTPTVTPSATDARGPSAEPIYLPWSARRVPDAASAWDARSQIRSRRPSASPRSARIHDSGMQEIALRPGQPVRSSVVVDDALRVQVVWEESGEIFHAYQQADGWSDVVKVAVGEQPVLAAAGDGLHVLFVNRFAGNFEIYHARRSDGEWSLPTNVSHTEGHSTAPVLRRKPGTDRLVAAWTELRDGAPRVHVGFFDGVAWRHQPVLQARGFAPAISIGQDGDPDPLAAVELAWHGRPTPGDQFGIFASSRRDGGWRLPERVDDQVGEHAVAASLSHEHDLVALWTLGTQQIRSSRRLQGWRSPVEVGSGVDARLLRGPMGRVAVWSRHTGAPSTGRPRRGQIIVAFGRGPVAWFENPAVGADGLRAVGAYGGYDGRIRLVWSTTAPSGEFRLMTTQHGRCPGCLLVLPRLEGG